MLARIGLRALNHHVERVFNPNRKFFIIPGHGDTLRVSGKGQIVRDSALQNSLAQ
jgi:hypothetical protein